MWIADKLAYRNQENFIRAYKGNELVWEKSTQPYDEIWYTSTDANVVQPYDTSAFGPAVLLSNTYSGRYGILKFDRNITSLEGNAFNGCSRLETIMFPDTLIYINDTDTQGENSIFRGCIHLTSISINGNPLLYNSGDHMFGRCNSLTEIPDIQYSRIANAYSMFSYCSSITNANIEFASWLVDARYLFDYCTSLVSATIDGGLRYIDYMFYNCTSLENVYELDTSSCFSMDYLFAFCSSLTTVNGIDFSSITTSPFHFLQYAGGSITHFIVNGSISFSWDDEWGLNTLENIDYDSVKSILQAMGRCDNPYTEKTMSLNRTIADKEGELTSLVADCESKGWTITGLVII